MEDNRISFGKRPKNPLRKRVWKDIRRDWKRYLMILIMLVVTIGYVSGMYVANNSMIHSIETGITEFNRENGHFRLSAIADEDTLAGIASGELADVPAVFRRRAYAEAEDEVKKAVDEGFRENVEKQVSEAIESQVKAGIDEQTAAAKKMGMNISDEELRAMTDKALEKAMKENYDSAVSEALEAAMESDAYDEAISDAMDEAKKEIDKEIDEKYAELSDRYGLDEEFKPVPVDIYDLFYKDTDEILTAGGEKSGAIRVYKERKETDLYDIHEGRSPETDHEIVIDRMHADNAGIKTGDTIYAGNADFEVVGLVAFVDYTTLYESNTDTMFDALTFNVAMTTDEGFDRIRANTRGNYAFRYRNAPADEYEEKEMSDHFLKALITQTAASETKDLEIKDYVPAYLNNAITFAPNDMGNDKAIGGVLLYILTAVLAFIFAVTISTTLEQESSVIGTLRASGYTKGELLRYYMSAPLLVIVIAAIAGNILGYTLFKYSVVSTYYNSYSLPNYETLWTPEAFIRTTIVPIVLMLIINLIVIIRTLKLSPLRFLRHDLRRSKRKKALRLPKWKFMRRFRMRVFLQNIPNYIMLFVGITFVMLLLSMVVGMPETLKYYQDTMPDMMFAKDQVILSSTEDEDGDLIETSAENAEKFSVHSLVRHSDIYDEEVAVYGIDKASSYIQLSGSNTDPDSVYISSAFAEKYNIKKGDTIVLSEKYEHKDYEWKVYDISDYSASIAVFMTSEQFNEALDKEEDYFSGYMSDEKITDIDEKYIAKEITTEDMTKIARQMDHSLGAYMEYFKYV